MKIINKNISFLLGVFFLIVSCNSDYFDVDTPYNATNKENVSMNDLLAPSIYHTITAQYNAGQTFGNYSQYFTGQSGNAAEQTTISNAWSQIYLYALPNLNTIIEKAKKQNAPHFEAIAKTLIAVNIGLATDSWGDIPFSEASKGQKSIKPTFDTQESIYSSIKILLTEAIQLLEKPDNSIYKVTKENDLIYKGNTKQWLKLAYTLRARYTLHLSKVDNNANMSSILSDLSKGMSSNDDDFQMLYTDKNINPWYSREVLSKNTGNDHDKIGDQLVSYMNGKSYPFTTIDIDPRLPIYAKLSDNSNTWRGYVSGGDGLSSDGKSGNTDFAENGFYTNSSAPIVVLSYAEALFIKAEALFITNGGSETSQGTVTEAYNAYKLGIEKNMQKIGVSITDISKYLSDKTISLGESNLKLEHIMKEKYIANFLNPETYVDLRRYNFSTNIFKDFELPANNADSEFPGKWLVRAIYPSSESAKNPDNVNANKKPPTEPVWWNK